MAEKKLKMAEKNCQNGGGKILKHGHYDLILSKDWKIYKQNPVILHKLTTNYLLRFQYYELISSNFELIISIWDTSLDLFGLL